MRNPPCREKKLRKEDLELFQMSTSREELCARAGGDLVHQRRGRTKYSLTLTKLMLTTLDDAVSVKTANKSTKSIWQTLDTIR